MHANGTRVLYLGLPEGAIRASVRGALAAAGIPVTEPHGDILAVPLASDTLIRLSTDFRRLLTDDDLEPCKALVLAEGANPSLADLMRTQSLRTLVADVEGEWLLAMIRDERLVSHFQPIVHAGAPDTAFGYEALLRGLEHDGTIVPPKRLFEAARSPELLFHLDRLGRLTAIRGAIAHNLTTRLFINVNPAAIDDPASHLRSTISAIAESGMSPEQIVFEVVESEKIRDVKHLVQVLDFYRGAGFGVALDDLGAGYSSLNLLTQLRPDFVKLDIEMVRNVDADPYRAEIVAKFLESARNLGIRTVAEGVETEGEWRWFRAHDVDYLQGFLFARPGLPPPVPKPPAS
jgi:EAL domain-containing protein (putative c-di-GMP-specific phosphodiesterase class I)